MVTDRIESHVGISGRDNAAAKFTSGFVPAKPVDFNNVGTATATDIVFRKSRRLRLAIFQEEFRGRSAYSISIFIVAVSNGFNITISGAICEILCNSLVSVNETRDADLILTGNLIWTVAPRPANS